MHRKDDKVHEGSVLTAWGGVVVMAVEGTEEVVKVVAVVLVVNNGRKRDGEESRDRVKLRLSFFGLFDESFS